MTRREFDALTRCNFGCRMASDERAHYRFVRHTYEAPQRAEHDYVTLRATVHARRNRREARPFGNGPIPALDRATIFRAWAEARHNRGAELLGASILFS